MLYVILLMNFRLIMQVLLQFQKAKTVQIAGLAVGYWDSMDDIKRNWAIDRVFEPEIEADLREKKLKMWKKAVACAFNWAKDD